MIPTNEIRKDFPLLNQENTSIIYFDNACMSLRPIQVIEAITNYYTTMSACAGRSNHRLADAVFKAVEQARVKVQSFIGASKKEEIIFLRNTSEGLNLVANSLELLAGDVVVLSDKEHNSNLVPWLRLKETKRIEIRIVKSDQNNEADLHAWQQAIDERVKLVSLVHTSNLDGVTNPIRDIAKLAHQAGALVMVDAAQAAPHHKLNVRELDVDFLVFSAHKLCGPTGMGVLFGKQSLLERLQPFLVGGDTVLKTTYESYEMLPIPEKFEAGLQDYAGIIGTGAAVDYVKNIGMESIEKHEQQLNSQLTEGLKHFSRIKIIGPIDATKRGGITSFVVDDADHHQVALMLDKTGSIMVRSGQHCVHSWCNDRGISGSVRASLYFYNTADEVTQFLKTMEQILQII